MKSEQGLGLLNPCLPGEGGTRSDQNTLVSTGPGVDQEAGSWPGRRGRGESARQAGTVSSHLTLGQAGHWAASQTCTLLRHVGKINPEPVLALGDPPQISFLLVSEGCLGGGPSLHSPQLLEPPSLLFPCELTH